jgi:hypothetical protein
MGSDRKPVFTNNSGLFSIASIIPHFILIAFVIGVYYYFSTHGLFPLWINYIYYGVKIFVALEIILGAGRSIVMPILALLGGILFLFTNQVYGMLFISPADAWQLIIVAFVGLLVTMLVKW